MLQLPHSLGVAGRRIHGVLKSPMGFTAGSMVARS